MPTPTKPVRVLRTEGRSHRTKAELEAREQAEKSVQSGRKISEQRAVRENPVAHKVFLKVRAMMDDIDRNDKLHEAVINRYCLITAECEDAVQDRALIERRCQHLEDALDRGEIDAGEYYRAHQRAVDQKNAVDRALQTKRRMLLDIEKECLMTVAAALRAIPKKAEDDAADDPMSRMLAERMAARGG